MTDTAKTVIKCLCGHGDDGKHEIMASDSFWEFIICPSCPPGVMYGYDPAYVKFERLP